ncbi:MAG: hypothetical protein A3I68_02885 [Candidatus Melainabacteria bacterium RIFCSPLOWO2_02_FULL_35_15]|nr:MAG: hypothetical protein A3F80_01130 [Candidatus Melainabacteria bacterium RIFCSPLOWO2_12_FULL_35_11]OGI13073.1 MAG: hypothetical protein A3I68_02885 [Candidatus Melainabacteria bacterium RIFCSPLOWO2_02_FULL_35_15]
MKKRILLTTLLVLLTAETLSILPVSATEKLSRKQEEKLKELSEIFKPDAPIFGKINTPIKAGVSIFRLFPETINLSPQNKSTIKLQPKEKGNLSDLEIRQKDLQKEEEEGLNFIQPSLALTPEEQRAIDDFFSRNEQEQLLNLWKATIERNKTIQFIVQKLSPASSPQEGNSLLSRTLGAAIFLPFYALQALTNNAGAYYGSQVGGRVLGSVIEGKMKKNQAQIQLSQTEAIILFMMIDEVAERLRQRYHSYKKLMVERALATNELEEAKKDNLTAQDSDSAPTQLLTDIQRRSIEREIRRLDTELRAQRNTLIELSGPVAVEDLDKQLQLELAATQNTPLDFLGVEEK